MIVCLSCACRLLTWTQVLVWTWEVLTSLPRSEAEALRGRPRLRVLPGVRVGYSHLGKSPTIAKVLNRNSGQSRLVDARSWLVPPWVRGHLGSVLLVPLAATPGRTRVMHFKGKMTVPWVEWVVDGGAIGGARWYVGDNTRGCGHF